MLNPWTAWVELTHAQRAFLEAPNFQVVWRGGGVGGTTALIYGALQHAQLPDYTAAILRHSQEELEYPHGIKDRLHRLLHKLGKWNEGLSTWTFPSGAQLIVTAVGADDYDIHRKFGGLQLNYLAIDQIDKFKLRDFAFLETRVRATKGGPIPRRIRIATDKLPNWSGPLLWNGGAESHQLYFSHYQLP